MKYILYRTGYGEVYVYCIGQVVVKYIIHIYFMYRTGCDEESVEEGVCCDSYDRY